MMEVQLLKKQTKALLWLFGKEMTILRKLKNNWETKVCIRKLNFKEKLLRDLVDKSNSSFKGIKRMGCIFDRILKYFTNEFKKATNLG